METRPSENINDVIYGSYFRDTSDLSTLYYQRSKAGVYFTDTPNIDAFGRLRVSLPHTLFDATLYDGISTISFDTSTSDGGTALHNSDKKAAILTATTTLNSTAILQTRQYLKYNPAKSQLIVMTGNLKGAATNVRKRLGQFDENNGFFFELNSSTLSVNLRSKISGSVVDTSVSQSSWNLDTLDGTGGTSNPSGILLDTSKQLIFMINYQWLGSGRAIFAFNIGGKIIPVHQFLSSNVNTTMYSQTATLPLRFEIVNLGATTSTMEVTCMACITENSGNDAVIGTPYSVSNGVSGRSISGSTVNYPVISIRKKTAKTEIPLRIYEASLFLGSSDRVMAQIVFNATLTGASWSDAPAGNAQYDISATSTAGTGTVIHTSYINGASGGGAQDVSAAFNETALMTLGRSIAGASDTLSIVFSNISNGSTAYGAFNYKELTI
jgi:hypothetical protein